MKFLTSITLPNCTTVERDALTPEAGDIIFNTDANAQEVYNGMAWGSYISTNVDSGVRGYIMGAVPVNTTLVFNRFNTPTVFEIAIAKSKIMALTTPTDTVTINIFKSTSPYDVDVQIGSFTFAQGAMTPSITFANKHTLQIDDIIKVISPNDTHGMRDLYIDIVGHTKLPVY